MDFGSAIKLLKEGKKITRKGWDGVDKYIELASDISYKNSANEIINAEHMTIGNKAIQFINISGVQLGWTPSQVDILAEDWVIKKDYEKKEKVKCPFCGKEVWIQFDCLHDYVDTIEAETYIGFCDNCKGFVSRFIDKSEKDFIGKSAFYKAHPEKYDLKKYMWFLLERLKLIKKDCDDFLENNKNLPKEIKDFIECCFNTASIPNKDTDDRFDFLIELSKDLLDKKYEIIINKKGG